jgi:uncharacterized protein YciI
MLAAMSRPRTWYVLQHRPGPAAAPGVRITDHPGFAGHLAFLRRRAEDGTLVAAGPLDDTADAEGEGITVLATQSPEHARELAEGDDEAVRSGLLVVTIRTWTVVMGPPDDEEA